MGRKHFKGPMRRLVEDLATNNGSLWYDISRDENVVTVEHAYNASAIWGVAKTFERYPWLGECTTSGAGIFEWQIIMRFYDEHLARKFQKLINEALKGYR